MNKTNILFGREGGSVHVIVRSGDGGGKESEGVEMIVDRIVDRIGKGGIVFLAWRYVREKGFLCTV